MRILLTITFSVALIWNSVAQEILIKEPSVLINGKEVLKYEINTAHVSYFNLEGDEIFMFKFFFNDVKDYYVLNFLTHKVKVESSDFSYVLHGYGTNSKKNIHKLISWLVKEKVIDLDGNINVDKLEIFFEKYDENLTN